MLLPEQNEKGSRMPDINERADALVEAATNMREEVRDIPAASLSAVQSLSARIDQMLALEQSQGTAILSAIAGIVPGGAPVVDFSPVMQVLSSVADRLNAMEGFLTTMSSAIAAIKQTTDLLEAQVMGPTVPPAP